MRYLKTFESIDDIPYQEITTSEACLYLYGGDHLRASIVEEFISENWEDITQKEIDTIGKIFENTRNFLDYHIDVDFYYYKKYINVANISCSITIYKLRDEWYYIDFIKHDLRKMKSYRCDQFDGLIQCLSDIRNEVISL